MTQQTRPILLETIALSKSFGTLKANDDIHIRIKTGEIHALLGENGAGKSTLVKMLFGALHPSHGEIRWKNQPVRLSTPAQARKLGISMVFQTFSLFDSLTVAENLLLALPDRKIGPDFDHEITEISADYGLSLRPDILVADLSVGQRQRVEILRCLLQHPELLIMDEPTAVLTPQEAEQLFEILKRLASEGCAILYISHRLDEVQKLCDQATILRHGQQVAALDPQQESAKSLAKWMVGEDVHQIRKNRTKDTNSADLPRFQINNLSCPADNPFGTDLQNINLSVAQGEILAIAGVAGNGQNELFQILSGEKTIAQADALLCLDPATHELRPIGKWDITQRRQAKMAFIPEERLGHGSVPHLPLSENLLLTRLQDLLHQSFLGKMGFINRRKALTLQTEICQRQDVRKGKADPDAAALSGGNLQKFIVGRELQSAPHLLIINQPTWGVDAGAAALIRQELVDLADQGASIIIISQDLDEIFEISDRIAVLSRGQLSQPNRSDAVCLDEIGLLMSHAEKNAA